MSQLQRKQQPQRRLPLPRHREPHESHIGVQRDLEAATINSDAMALIQPPSDQPSQPELSAAAAGTRPPIPVPIIVVG
jgi:hypothetical protein